jgi:hypothetical protein
MPRRQPQQRSSGHSEGCCLSLDGASCWAVQRRSGGSNANGQPVRRVGGGGGGGGGGRWQSRRLLSTSLLRSSDASSGS